MSFIGSIGVFMAVTGLKEILSSKFEGTDNIIPGKKFPMNLRTQKFVTIELLKGHMKEANPYDELEQ